VEWAAQFTAFGEVFTLPVVVLLSSVLQPRLQYALARDGFLPSLFGETDHTGNLKKGVVVAGTLMTLFAAFLPFATLDDFVSAGILVAFSVTNASLVIMRHESPERHPYMLEKLLVVTNCLSLLTGLVIRHDLASAAGKFFAIFFFLLTISTGVLISLICPKASSFGGRRAEGAEFDPNTNYFETPWTPLIPLLGIFCNWYLVAQLEFRGIATLALYILLLGAFYFSYGAKNSVGNITGWGEIGLRAPGTYEMVSGVEGHDGDNGSVHEVELTVHREDGAIT
jgi:APA family basic amino acid/polyamine antiporter